MKISRVPLAMGTFCPSEMTTRFLSIGLDCVFIFLGPILAFLGYHVEAGNRYWSHVSIKICILVYGMLYAKAFPDRGAGFREHDSTAALPPFLPSFTVLPSKLSSSVRGLPLSV